MATATRAKPKDSETKTSNATLGIVAGATAAGAALGVLALLGRKAAVQAPTALAGDWKDALELEHRATLKVFDLIQATDASNVIKRTMLLKHLKHALSKHAIEEEMVIYPALRDIGETAGADELTSEHGYVKQYLYDLENMPKDNPEWIVKVGEFRRTIEEHIEDEEQRLFPRLHGAMGETKNKQLTAQMNREGFKLA
jgi:hemerythrin superfamily protein